jgi:hypothetical protein
MTGVGSEAVDRFGGKSRNAPFTQKANGFRDTCFVGLPADC